MWKSSVFNSSDIIREFTLGARAVLDPQYIQAKVQGEKLTPDPHHVYNWNISSLCTWCRAGRGGWRTEPNNQPCNFPSASHRFCSEQDAPIVLNRVKKKKKNNLQRLLFSEISHRRKELRLSNLIQLGLLCLNPWSKVFNQLWGDRGRRVCVGSPGCRRVGEGQRGAGPWSVTELPPSPRGAGQALFHTSFQQCKAAYACRSFQDTNDN